MRLIKDWLPDAVRDGADLRARSHMLAAASMGAAAFQKGLGAIHALSHQINALFGTHHGLTNAVLMPYVMVFNRPAIEDKTRRLAGYLSLPETSFGAVLDWVLALRRELAIPNTVEALGVTADALDEIAARAAVDPTAPTNPIPAGAAEMAAHGSVRDGRGDGLSFGRSREGFAMAQRRRPSAASSFSARAIWWRRIRLASAPRAFSGS